MCARLLIADDEDVVRNGLEKYIRLHTERFEKIYTAENGEKALDIILRYKPENTASGCADAGIKRD